jgi:cation diffusion facilitator CzcD-associated flavoprotein CzcO
MTTAVNTVVVVGGQAGLAVSYYLKRRSQDHVVLEQADRPGNGNDEPASTRRLI